MESMQSSAAASKRHPPAPPPPLLLPHLVPNNVTQQTPSKKRSFSDSTPVLDPSPKIDEPSIRRRSKDDENIIATPSRAPKRTALASAAGLHLQMPPRDTIHSSIQNSGTRGAQSPQAEFEPRELYGSPSSVLPRHSRGLDFSRACTNLHHSTLAEQSSPDSSPTVTQRGFMPSSRRSSIYSMMVDSPRLNFSTSWTGNANGDRSFVPKSIASTTTMASDASSSSSDEDDISMLQDEPDDTMIATPHMRKSDGGSAATTPFVAPAKLAEFSAWNIPTSPGPNAFVNYRRNMLQRRHSRQSRTSWNSRSRTSSPDGLSGQNNSESRAFTSFSQDTTMRSPPSRRDSLSLGINHGLHITSSNESGDENAFSISPMTPGVVRRPVTRRSNMLPKTKTFARIRATLQEEAAPVDSEARRESEVVRQVRVKDVGLKGMVPATPLSPDLTPSVANYGHDSSEMSEMEALSAKGGYEGPPKEEEDESEQSIRSNPAQKMFSRARTPPPLLQRQMLHRQRSSSGVSEDVSMDSPFASTPPSSVLSAGAAAAMRMQENTSETAASTSPFQAPALPSAAEVTRKAHGKRLRDDEFDPHSQKRRAVSPGVSTHNSPVLAQSPASAGGNGSGGGTGWGKSSKSSTSEKSSGTPGNEEKPNSASTTNHGTPTLGPTRVGLQGMVDTNDGLMNMSIE